MRVRGSEFRSLEAAYSRCTDRSSLDCPLAGANPLSPSDGLAGGGGETLNQELAELITAAPLLEAFSGGPGKPCGVQRAASRNKPGSLAYDRL